MGIKLTQTEIFRDIHKSAQNGTDEDPQGQNVVSRIKRSPYMGIKWTQTETIYGDKMDLMKSHRVETLSAE